MIGDNIRDNIIEHNERIKNAIVSEYVLTGDIHAMQDIPINPDEAPYFAKWHKPMTAATEVESAEWITKAEAQRRYDEWQRLQI